MSIQIAFFIQSISLLLIIGIIIWLIREKLPKSNPSQNVLLRPPISRQPFKKQNNRSKSKYRKSALMETEKVELLTLITKHLEQDKLYAQPNLTVKKLAQQVHLPRQHLSQVINEKTGGNFTDFINQYRIQAAKELLQAPEFAELPTVAIGRKVGFKAKSTFYAVFKKYTQQSPAAFRRNNRVPSSARDYP